MSGNDDAMMVTGIESDRGLGPYLHWIWLTRWQVASIPQGILGSFMAPTSMETNAAAVCAVLW